MSAVRIEEVYRQVRREMCDRLRAALKETGDQERAVRRVMSKLDLEDFKAGCEQYLRDQATRIPGDLRSAAIRSAKNRPHLSWAERKLERDRQAKLEATARDTARYVALQTYALWVGVNAWDASTKTDWPKWVRERGERVADELRRESFGRLVIDLCANEGVERIREGSEGLKDKLLAALGDLGR